MHTASTRLQHTLSPSPTTPVSALAMAGVLFSLPMGSAEGDDDEKTWRPPIEDLFKTELVFTQDQGELQTAAFPTYRNGPDGSAFVLPIGIEYGITDSLQLEVEWDAYIDADTSSPDESGSGQGNLQLGLMYSFIDIGDRGYHVAVGFEYEFASGDRKFLEGESREDAQEIYLIFAKDLEEGARSQLFLQAGVELQTQGGTYTLIDTPDLDEDDDDGEDESDEQEEHDSNVWFANLGGYTAFGKTVLSFELNLSEDQEERYATPGISYTVMDDMEIGVGVAVGLTQEADHYQVIGKLLWEFGD